MKDEQCIFCKLANGVIPTNTIYEDEDFKAILDISPASKGHALILPKEHYANLYEVDEETLTKAIKLAKRIVEHETKVLGCDGYNLLQNNGTAAGQTVYHFHIHMIPRYEGEEDMVTWETKELDASEADILREKMKME